MKFHFSLCGESRLCHFSTDETVQALQEYDYYDLDEQTAEPKLSTLRPYDRRELQEEELMTTYKTPNVEQLEAKVFRPLDHIFEHMDNEMIHLFQESFASLPHVQTVSSNHIEIKEADAYTCTFYNLQDPLHGFVYFLQDGIVEDLPLDTIADGIEMTKTEDGITCTVLDPDIIGLSIASKTGTQFAAFQKQMSPLTESDIEQTFQDIEKAIAS